MLDINLSTLILQIANFFIMAYVLTRFLFKPLKEMLDRRARRVTQGMDEAENATRAAEVARLEYEQKRDNIEAEFAALKNEARIVIDQTRQQMIQEAYEEIETMRAHARDEIEQQRAEALRLHRSKIGEVVATLVQRMMVDMLNPDIHDAYLDAFLDQLPTLGLARRTAGNGKEAVPAELITAIPLLHERQAHVTAALEATISQPVDLTYRVDPNLIAGAMVRLGDTLIDGSLQGQIQQLRSRYEAEIG
jgi:F-type H+-transporting ATPase subunit b